MYDGTICSAASAIPRQLWENATPNAEQDVEPMFPEPLVELDLDELE
jgi:hypothetical protein